ncbi:antitoxin [Lentilactobacillus sp. Marseille-Q4993]|uniref:antitoxin n=1 Tax=Lentilactobacillus sp. Marseille-Q4993 TaxID=3039492 RepID=UPI0024BC7BD1|nr:antitoxin [Lentilactobacillus sp. Marseille-Q4993]
MEKASKKNFSLVINDHFNLKVEHFCKTMESSQKSSANILLNYFFEDPKTINSLMTGYREMANLNREITKDFLASEDDAELHLTQFRNQSFENNQAN